MTETVNGGAKRTAKRGGAKRIYGIVEGGDLGWVEERVHPERGLVPHMSARLRRIAG